MKAINYTFKDFFFRVTCFMFWLVTCPVVSGQANQKRQLTADDYKMWSNLKPGKISINGNWVSYNLNYKYTDNDTLFVQNSDDPNKKIIFPNAKNGKFNAESHFGFIARDTFNLIDLKTRKFYKRASVKSFEFSSNQKYAILFVKQSNGKSALEIMDTKGNISIIASDVTNYFFDPKLQGLAYSMAKDKKFQMEIILFKNSIEKKLIFESGRSPFKNTIWKKDAVAFIEDVTENPVLYNYDIKLNKLDSLTSDIKSGFPSNMTISSSNYGIPVRSDDGAKLFFWMKETQYESKRYRQNDVQIWNSADKQLFDFQKERPFYTWSDKLAVWNLKEHTVAQITDKEFPNGFLSADYKTAFIYDPVAYEPHTRQIGPYDLYAMDLGSQKKNLVVKNYTAGAKPNGSVDGKYLCYAKEGQWWIYDILQKCNTCITQGIASSFFSEENSRPGENPPYGIAGWTKDSQIILYDRYDLWLFSSDGKSKKRLTDGMETKKTYRVQHFDIEVTFGDTETKKYPIDLSVGFLMTATDKETGKSGLSYWNAKTGTKELVWDDIMILPVAKAKNNNTYMYVEQNFCTSPSLFICNNKTKEIVQTNRQQQQYEWPRNEKIEYTVNGKKVKGILYYPAGFKKGEKLPMVVYIYEHQFYKLNQYENPTLLSGDGFNITNFTANGYFVLLPDIIYDLGNLCESVPKSVLAAVDSVLEKGDVNSHKMAFSGIPLADMKQILL